MLLRYEHYIIAGVLATRPNASRKICLFRCGRIVLLPEEQGRERFLDSSFSTFLSPRPTCVLQYSSTGKNITSVLVWNCNDIFIKLSEHFSLDEWVHMKKFWWFEQAFTAFTFIFCVCSTRIRLLPVVMVEILCRLLVQHVWDQELLASFEKVQWKKSDAVLVRKCYVMCFQNSTWTVFSCKWWWDLLTLLQHFEAKISFCFS